MYKNKALNGKNNICGRKIKTLRKQLDPKVSQRSFAERLQLNGIDLDKNAIQRIESGQRFVTDIELKEFAKILNITADELLDEQLYSVIIGEGRIHHCKIKGYSRV